VAVTTNFALLIFSMQSELSVSKFPLNKPHTDIAVQCGWVVQSTRWQANKPTAMENLRLLDTMKKSS